MDACLCSDTWGLGGPSAAPKVPRLGPVSWLQFCVRLCVWLRRGVWPMSSLPSSRRFWARKLRLQGSSTSKFRLGPLYVASSSTQHPVVSPSVSV